MIMNKEKRVMSLKQNIQKDADLSSCITDLENLLSVDCAELDKAKVS